MYQHARIAEVKGAVEGSGYVVAPDLILTAWHVVRHSTSGDQVPVFVRTYRDYSQAAIAARYTMRSARVIWPASDPGEDNDFALLHAPGARGPDSQLVSWGPLPETGPVEVDGIGFPDTNLFLNRFLGALGMQPFKERDTREIKGSVRAGSNFKQREIYDTGAFSVMLSDDDSLGSKEGWSGMSGAPVFAGRVLVGIVRSVADVRDHHSLKALPVNRLFRRPEVVEAVRAVGLAMPSRVSADSSPSAFDPSAFLHLLDRKPVCDEIIIKLDEWDEHGGKPLLLALRGRQDDELGRLFLRLSEEELEKYGLEFLVKHIEWPQDVTGANGRASLLRDIKTEFVAEKGRARQPLLASDIKDQLPNDRQVLFIHTIVGSSTIITNPAQAELLDWWRSFWEEVASTGVKVVLLVVFVDPFALLPCCTLPLSEPCRGLERAPIPPMILHPSWIFLCPSSVVNTEDLSPWFRRIRHRQPDCNDAIQSAESRLSLQFDKALPRGLRCVKFGLPACMGRTNAQQ